MWSTNWATPVRYWSWTTDLKKGIHRVLAYRPWSYKAHDTTSILDHFSLLRIPWTGLYPVPGYRLTVMI
jgi:hypothetical protein